jgi:hypothetical protein
MNSLSIPTGSKNFSPQNLPDAPIMDFYNVIAGIQMWVVAQLWDFTK